MQGQVNVFVKQGKHQMMRHVITLALIARLWLCAVSCLHAQDFTFSDRGVQQLAKVIAETAKQTNRLPSASAFP